MANISKLCEAITISGNSVITLLGNKNQNNFLNLKVAEIINGVVITIQATTAALGFTGGGAGKVKLQESADGVNWTDISSAEAAIASAEGTYTIRVTGSLLPMKHKLRLAFYNYDSGNYIFDVFMYRLSGE